MNTNDDRVRDNFYSCAEEAISNIGRMLNEKDERIADLEHQLDVVTAALVKERGVPI